MSPRETLLTQDLFQRHHSKIVACCLKGKQAHIGGIFIQRLGSNTVENFLNTYYVRNFLNLVYQQKICEVSSAFLSLLVEANDKTTRT